MVLVMLALALTLSSCGFGGAIQEEDEREQVLPGQAGEDDEGDEGDGGSESEEGEQGGEGSDD